MGKIEADGKADRFEAVAEQLCSLGATLVLKDEGSVKVRALHKR